jgi:hypothetical protein
LVKRSLQVSNPNNQPVAFKVKTTAPKQYCVRPNSGRIEPGEKVEVQGESSWHDVASPEARKDTHFNLVYPVQSSYNQ